MAAATSLTFLLTIWINAVQAKNLMELYAYCYNNADAMASLKRGEMPTPEKLPEWCITMRNDVAPCILEKIVSNDRDAPDFNETHAPDLNETDAPDLNETDASDLNELIQRIQFPLTDDGSIASRGNVLLTFYKIAKYERIYTHVKLYHYGCLYNSWYNYLRDEKCYKKMLSQCVHGNQSCYYIPCGGGDQKRKVFKVLSTANKDSEAPKSSAYGLTRYLVTISLTALLYVV